MFVEFKKSSLWQFHIFELEMANHLFCLLYNLCVSPKKCMWRDKRCLKKLKTTALVLGICDPWFKLKLLKSGFVVTILFKSKESWNKPAFLQICYLQWKPVNVIILGPSLTDNINWMITICGYFCLVMYLNEPYQIWSQ